MNDDLFGFKPLKGLENLDDLNKLTLQKVASQEAYKEWAAANPELVKERARAGGIASEAIGCKIWREKNPEAFKAVQEMAIKAFMESDYWHSEKHIASLSKGGVASSVVNLEKGNIGKDSAMSRYKIAKKAKERAKLLLTLPEYFKSKDANKLFTKKQWLRITNETDLVIKISLGNYKLNYEALNEAMKNSTNPDDYFKN